MIDCQILWYSLQILQHLWNGGDQWKLYCASKKEKTIWISRCRLNCCNRKTLNYKSSENMVVWVDFPSFSFSCNREREAGHLCISDSQGCAESQVNSTLLLCHFLRYFPLIYMVKASILAPHLHFRLGKGEREVACKKFVKDLMWKMHLLFPFIPYNENIVVTLNCCQGSCKFSLPRWPCALVLMVTVKHLAACVFQPKENSMNKDMRKNLLQVVYGLFEIDFAEGMSFDWEFIENKVEEESWFLYLESFES